MTEPTIIYVRGGIAEVWSSPTEDDVHIIDWDEDHNRLTPEDAAHVADEVRTVAAKLREYGEESTARMLEKDYQEWNGEA